MPRLHHFRVSVSGLCLCRRCPRLFARQCTGDKHAWRAGLEGTFNCGSVFHQRIAALFHRDAAGLNGREKKHEILDIIKNNSCNSATLKKALGHHVCRDYYFPFLEKEHKNPNTVQIVSLNQCIEKWMDFLADFFCCNSGFRKDPLTVTEHAFYPTEGDMNASYTTDGAVISVSGRYDCVLWDQTSKELLLVDFKCRREADLAEDLLQLALCAWLIQQNTGLLPRVSVLYLEEENPVRNFSASETDGIIALLPPLFDRAIQTKRTIKSGNGTIPKTDNPSLCKKCHYHKDCDARFGKTTDDK